MLKRELGGCLLSLSCWEPALVENTGTGGRKQGREAGAWAETGP